MISLKIYKLHFQHFYVCSHTNEMEQKNSSSCEERIIMQQTLIVYSELKDGRSETVRGLYLCQLLNELIHRHN